MPDRYESTVYPRKDLPFTAEDHGALARLIYKRFGEDLESATIAWRRLLQNGATEADFAEIMKWEPEESIPPVHIPPHLYFTMLRTINAKKLLDTLNTMCEPGHRIVEIRILTVEHSTITGNMRVQKNDNWETYRFRAVGGPEGATVKAFNKTRRL